MNSKYIFLFAVILYLFPNNNLMATKEESMEKVINEALCHAQKQYLRMAQKLSVQETQLPKTFEKGQLVTSGSDWWCSGFFPGSLWYLYEYSRDKQVLDYARMYTARVEREKYTTDNHDIGFILYCSYGNGLRLTGEPSYRDVLLTGAQSLATRYSPSIGLIRSWDFNENIWQYPVIIDNMMNLEMMLWVAKEFNQPLYKEISISHADLTMKNHYRPDNSCFHVVSYDTITGQPHAKHTHQGYSHESAWSRGQAWGLYGYTFMYRETQDKKYLVRARKIADYLLNHPKMPKDYIPYWDFDDPQIPNALRDASAASIMASSLIELSTYVDQTEKQRYLDVAEKQIRTLASPAYTAEVGENGNFILMHSVGSLPANSEIDVPLTYADYYYLEALIRYKRLLSSDHTFCCESKKANKGQEVLIFQSGFEADSRVIPYVEKVSGLLTHHRRKRTYFYPECRRCRTDRSLERQQYRGQSPYWEMVHHGLLL